MDKEFADVKSEGNSLDIDKAFERLETTETTTPPESQSETKEVPAAEGDKKPETAEVKPEPFHKHPRWIKVQQDLKEATDKLQKLESERSQGLPVTLPDWWKAQNGDSEESIERYRAVITGELPWLKEQILQEIEAKQQAEQKQTQAGEEYVDTQLAEMADEGLSFERNKLLKFMVDFQEEYGSGALLDPEGNYDFRKSLKLMNQLQPPVEPDKTVQKQVASQAGRAKATVTSQNTIPVVNTKRLRRGGWRDQDTGQFTSR